jgi:hypothetical protein
LIFEVSNFEKISRFHLVNVESEEDMQLSSMTDTTVVERYPSRGVHWNNRFNLLQLNSIFLIVIHSSDEEIIVGA